MQIQIWMKRLDRKTTWAKLRLFGNSHVAQATLVVPVLGYFILFNSNLVDYLRLHSDFCSGSSCEVSWRLYLLYFGCFIVAVGAATYSLVCPSVIKRYDGASDFFESEKVYFSSPRNLKYLFDEIELEKGSPAADHFQLKATIVDRNAALNLAHTHTLADVMAEYYVQKNISAYHFRTVSFISYVLGIFLLAIPTVLTFFQVIGRLVERFNS